jgi:hypothetical protein
VGFGGVSRILSIPPVPPLCLVTTFVTSALPIMRVGRILNTHPSRIRTGRASPLLSCGPNLTHEPSTKGNLTTNYAAEPQVNTYPASEQRISEVERGLICNAILPMPPTNTLSAGDSIIFALAYSYTGENIYYVQNGDSVCVSLTEVTDLGETDPATGQALFRLSWKPLGQMDSPGTIAKRVVKSRIAHQRG